MVCADSIAIARAAEPSDFLGSAVFTTVHTAHHGRAADGGAVRRGGLRRARDAERSAGGRLPGEGARPERGVLDRGRRPRPQPPGGAAAPPAQPMPRQHPPTPTTESAPHHGSCGRRPGCQRRRGATPSRWSTVTSPPTTWCPPCSRAASPSSTPPSFSRSSYRACDPPPARPALPRASARAVGTGARRCGAAGRHRGRHMARQPQRALERSGRGAALGDGGARGPRR